MVDKINIETNRNFNIDEKKNIHFIGIGGIGMSAIAEILRSQGHNITGSDMNRNEIVERLKDRGIFKNRKRLIMTKLFPCTEAIRIVI